jgi:hypothetical protein
MWSWRLFVLSSFILASTHAAEWHVGIVPDIPGGEFSSLKLDRLGNAHVVHVDGFELTLRYSFWDHALNKWFTTELERGVRFCSLALDSKQHPHISYPAGTGVVHKYWDGETWRKQIADVHARVINYYTSIGLDLRDNPIISFYEEVSSGDALGRLRIVAWNGSYWDLKTVDPDIGSGKFNSLATNSGGYPEIAYGNVEFKNLSLRYAHWDGKTWNTEILENKDPASPSSKWSVSMVLDTHDVPHIVYTDVGKHLVKYVTKRAAKWEFEVVDSIAKEAYPDRNGIAVDAQGSPYVSYYDAGAGVLKVAHRESGKWVAEIIDREFAGYTSSIQVGNDTILLTYGDEKGQSLRFAHRPINPPAPAVRQGPEAKQK